MNFLSLQERRVITKATVQHYQQATKKQRGQILTEVCHQTGYNRSYAAFLLHNWGRTVHMMIKGVRTIFVFGRAKQRQQRQCAHTYDDRVVRALKYLWALADGICSKRLLVWIRTTLPILERFEEIKLDEKTRQKLLTVSAPTIDRLLRPYRTKSRFTGLRSTTKPVPTCWDEASSHIYSQPSVPKKR